jgi:hypothetical protein
VEVVLLFEVLDLISEAFVNLVFHFVLLEVLLVVLYRLLYEF